MPMLRCIMLCCAVPQRPMGHGTAQKYLNNATDNSLPALLDKAQGGDVIQHILQVASWARMGVDATDSHIALCVHVAKLHLYRTNPALIWATIE